MRYPTHSAPAPRGTTTIELIPTRPDISRIAACVSDFTTFGDRSSPAGSRSVSCRCHSSVASSPAMEIRAGGAFIRGSASGMHAPTPVPDTWAPGRMRSQIASADMARKTGPMIRLVTSSAASVSRTSRTMVPTVSARRLRSATSASALEFSRVSALKPRATSRTSSTPVSSSALALRSPSRHRRTTALRAINGGATPRMMRRVSGTATARPTIAPTSSIATVVMVARRVVVSTSARPRCRATVRLALSDRKVSNCCLAAR